MTKILFIASLAAALVGVSTAQAQQEKSDKPCMADAARLCPDVQPGGGAQMECLKAHKEDLSPACKKKVMQTKIKHMENQELQKNMAPPQSTP